MTDANEFRDALAKLLRVVGLHRPASECERFTDGFIAEMAAKGWWPMKMPEVARSIEWENRMRDASLRLLDSHPSMRNVPRVVFGDEPNSSPPEKPDSDFEIKIHPLNSIPEKPDSSVGGGK